MDSKEKNSIAKVVEDKNVKFDIPNDVVLDGLDSITLSYPITKPPK